MLSLLLIVLILGIITYGIQALPIPPLFQTIAYCIIAIFLVITLFNALGVNLPSLR